jgi:hypothetical protein
MVSDLMSKQMLAKGGPAAPGAASEEGSDPLSKLNMIAKLFEKMKSGGAAAPTAGLGTDAGLATMSGGASGLPVPIA